MKALSLFSGIGGIDLACEWAGIETVAFCEREPFPQKVLRKHWPSVPIYDDVCTLTKERLDADGIGTIDIIHGGYPCQPFSHAGNRKGTEDDRHLWPEVFRLIQAIQPRWFVGENVAGHITLGLDLVLADLESISYEWETFVLPAMSIGAHHKRDRVFIVANAKSINDGKKVNTKDSRTQTLKLRSLDEQTIIPHTNSKPRLQTDSQPGSIRKKWRSRNNVSGSSRGAISGTYWDVFEPPVLGVANGVPDHMDRVKALGNAVVPQQIYPILAAIKQIDDMMRVG